VAEADFDRMADVYDRGRNVPLDALADWRRALAPWLDDPDGGTVLDVGSGTGIWSIAFVEWFGRAVVGIEPSAGMLRVAERKRPSDRIRFVSAFAEALPFAPETFAAAWLSTVIHHFGDLDGAARELRRVLAPGAPVLIRSGFPGRADDLLLFRFFPAGLRVQQTFPTLERTIEAFRGAGFALEDVRSVPQRFALDLRDYLERARLRADTVLQRIDDAAFARGIRELERQASEQGVPQAVVDALDLVVLR
jgi:SAM-dependent methyltransferase